MVRASEHGLFSFWLLATLSTIESLEKSFFAFFGQITLSDLNYVSSTRAWWTQYLFKVVFGGYLLISVVVLKTILIAVMSDTYQRIQVTLPSIFLNCSQFTWTQYYRLSFSSSLYLDKRLLNRRESIVVRVTINHLGQITYLKLYSEYTCWCQL